jgi:hypothetical protein
MLHTDGEVLENYPTTYSNYRFWLVSKKESIFSCFLFIILPIFAAGIISLPKQQWKKWGKKI